MQQRNSSCATHFETRLTKRHLISLTDLSKSEMERIFALAQEIKLGNAPPSLGGKILASCFFEPSTRTRLSFESAMLRLGGNVLGFAESQVTSAQKGESLLDSIRVIGSLADVIVLRHPKSGAARAAASVTSTPVINAGDGANEHPTQGLLDLFTMQELLGEVQGLHIALAGDLKYSRTIRSLILALRHYPIRLYLVSPPELPLPREMVQSIRQAGIKFSYHEDLFEILSKIDILYMTRRQAERSNDSLSIPYLLKKEHLDKVKPTLKIFHPLPRLAEIELAIDTTQHAAYFQQAANGLFVRQALLAMMLEG